MRAARGGGINEDCESGADEDELAGKSKPSRLARDLRRLTRHSFRDAVGASDG